MGGGDGGTGSNARRGVVVGRPGEAGRAGGRVDADAAVHLADGHSAADGSPVADLGGPLANAEGGCRRFSHSSLKRLSYLWQLLSLKTGRTVVL